MTMQHRVESALLRFVFAGFRALPLDTASFLGGFMGRSIGPFLKAHKTAIANIARAFPERSKEEHRQLALEMWDHLGRVAAEYPHLPSSALQNRVERAGEENFPEAGKQAIYFSGHIGNWELTYPQVYRNNIFTVLIYRQANNPGVNDVIINLRGHHCSEQIAKGAKNGIKIIRAIKDNKSLAMLIDQKMNEGIPVPFFGRDAMTAPAIAELALRYDLPLIPVRSIRTHGAHFKTIIYPPLSYNKTGDTEKDVMAIMVQINNLLESWIREYPAQWFWVHKRWPK